MIALGAIGGIAGAAGACGPIIGGWVATVSSWRDVFTGEAVVMVLLLGASTIIRDAPLGRARPRLDGVGGALSAGGLALAVLGTVQGSTWAGSRRRKSRRSAASRSNRSGSPSCPS